MPENHIKRFGILGGVSLTLILGITIGLDNSADAGLGDNWVIPQIFCDQGFLTRMELTHFDKIIFHTEEMQLKDSMGTIIPSNTPLDIKVLDFPNEVVDLRLKTIEVLTFLEYTRADDGPLFTSGIVIDDVAYAVACGEPVR